jgi:hypothetical protein
MREANLNLHRKTSGSVYNKMNYYKQADFITTSGGGLRQANIIERIAAAHPPSAFQSDSNDFSCYIALKNAQSAKSSTMATTTNASSSVNTTATTTTNNSHKPTSTSSVSSSEIFTDYEEKGRLIRNNNTAGGTLVNNGLICMTDGTTCSYKFLGGETAMVSKVANIVSSNQVFANHPQQQQLMLKNNNGVVINEKYCFIFICLFV